MDITILHKGRTYITTVDDTVDRLSLGRMYLIFNRNRQHHYVMCQDRQLLHRKLLNAPDGMLVDHINKNTLDNRLENLRLVTPAENTWNRKMQAGAAPNTSGFVGVTPVKNGKFVAGISHKNKRLNLGKFATAEEAARAYDTKAVELRGSMAILNFS